MQQEAAGAEAQASEGDRIEALLSEIRASAGPTTWARVEELVQRLVALYGKGLERLLEYGRSAGASEPAYTRALCGDEVVASLLLLHDLHPQTVEQRIAAALDRVRAQLGLHAGGIDLLGMDRDGVVAVRLTGACDGCASSQATIEGTVRAAIEAVAPEVTRIHVQGPPPSLPVLR